VKADAEILFLLEKSGAMTSAIGEQMAAGFILRDYEESTSSKKVFLCQNDRRNFS